MSQYDRLVFALDILEGDWDARFILADLLSEAGDDELCEFARDRRYINRQGDLELAIRLLAARHAISLGCAFLDRGMTGKGSIRRHAWLIARLAQVRRLLRSNAPLEQFVAQGANLTGYQALVCPGPDEQSLQAAARSLGDALEQAESDSAATLAVVSLARAMRRRTKGAGELEWQVEQTKDVLAVLIADLELASAHYL